jgi:hypothetical protein
MFELLFQKAENENLDIVQCNYTADFISHEMPQFRANKPVGKFQLSPQNLQNIHKNAFSGKDDCDFFIWTKIFNASFLKNHNLNFVDTRMTSLEDRLFVIETLFCTNKVGAIPNNFYHWVNHLSNTGKTYTTIQNNINYCLKLDEILKKYDAENTYYADFLRCLSATLYSPFYRVLTGKSNNEVRTILTVIKQSEIYKHINNMFKIKYLPIWFKQKPTISVFLISLKLMPRKFISQNK